jgi:hypothetical protein
VLVAYMPILEDRREGAQKECRTRKTLFDDEIVHCRQSADEERMFALINLRIVCGRHPGPAPE